MGEENQALVPPAFHALFTEPGRMRPSLPHEELARRHELCEDLALSLTERARLALWQHEATKSEVLLGVFHGLARPASGLNPAEAEWVTRRLAELLDLSQPTLPEQV